MGMDQMVYAKATNGQELLLARWEKNYPLTKWFQKTATQNVQENDEPGQYSWGCDVTREMIQALDELVELPDDLNDVDDTEIDAMTRYGRDDLYEFVWRARIALRAGFLLSFCTV